MNMTLHLTDACNLRCRYCYQTRSPERMTEETARKAIDLSRSGGEGVLAKGDIGALFPDNDPAFEGMESGILLSEVLLLLPGAGMRIRHVDLTVIAQIPRLAPHREGIRKSVAGLLGLTKDNVGFKATTEEGLGFTGAMLGIKAVAVVTAIPS